MRQGIFEVFGEGELGLKAEDLNTHSKILTECGLMVPEGIVIATGVYDEFSRLTLLSLLEGMVEELVHSNGDFDYSEFNNSNKESTQEFVQRQKCPAFLTSINEEILSRLEVNQPYAIRSSEISESGGIGIFKTEFFWPSGDKVEDLKNLWLCEVSVYASNYSADVYAWREKRRIFKDGMAILIMPVIGFHYEDYFLPPYVWNCLYILSRLTHG